jgi:hypothetical protein
MIGAPRKSLNYLVPEERLELSRGYPHRNFESSSDIHKYLTIRVDFYVIV